MIRFIVGPGHGSALRGLARAPGAPRLGVVGYDRLLAARRLARAVTVFTDVDRLHPWDRELAAAAARDLRRAGVPVLNDPARLRPRGALLRALHEAGLGDRSACRVDERVRPARFPVELRREAGTHPLLHGHLEDWDAARRAIDAALAAGVPEAQLLLVEHPSPTPPSEAVRWAFRVGERLVAEPGRELEADAAAALERAFGVAAVELGRADFRRVDGRVRIDGIEAGLAAPAGASAEVRSAVPALLVPALGELDRRERGRGRVRLRDPRLARARASTRGAWPWRRRVRSRPAP